jgi:hypothetical protein
MKNFKLLAAVSLVGISPPELFATIRLKLGHQGFQPPNKGVQIIETYLLKFEM